jgi:hypothetical protein
VGVSSVRLCDREGHKGEGVVARLCNVRQRVENTIEKARRVRVFFLLSEAPRE